jgi:hypothetical protein
MHNFSVRFLSQVDFFVMSNRALLQLAARENEEWNWRRQSQISMRTSIKGGISNARESKTSRILMLIIKVFLSISASSSPEEIYRREPRESQVFDVSPHHNSIRSNFKRVWMRAERLKCWEQEIITNSSTFFVKAIQFPHGRTSTSFWWHGWIDVASFLQQLDDSPQTTSSVKWKRQVELN